MKKYVLIVLLLFAAGVSFSQDSAQLKRIAFRTTLSHIQGRVTKDYLHTLTDSGVYLTHTSVPTNKKPLAGYNTQWFDYRNIDKIEIIRKNSASRGALHGLIIGGIFGTIVGLISYQKPEPSTFISLDFGIGLNALLGGTAGVVAGTAIGAICGAVAKKKFMIRGKKENYNMMHSYLLKRLYRRHPRPAQL